MKEISDEKWLATVGGGLLRESERNGVDIYPFIDTPLDMPPSVTIGIESSQAQKPGGESAITIVPLPKKTTGPWLGNLH